MKDIIYIFIGVFCGMGIYEILKAVSEKIRHQALHEELKKFIGSKLLDEGLKITIEKKTT